MILIFVLNIPKKKFNVYKGHIVNIKPNLSAAFVRYSFNKHGFLPLREISQEYFHSNAELNKSNKIDIKQVVKEGQEIVVQTEGEEQGEKGVALTTFVALPGTHLVLMPNSSQKIGVSRKVKKKKENEPG